MNSIGYVAIKISDNDEVKDYLSRMGKEHARLGLANHSFEQFSDLATQIKKVIAKRSGR